MSRVEDNQKVLDIWRNISYSKSGTFDEMGCKLLGQQNAILADISRSLAVIADNSYSDFDKFFNRNESIERNESNERSGSDDGEEKGL